MTSLGVENRFTDFKKDVLQGFFEQSKLAEENRELESHAATVIQSYYRAFVVRRSLSRLNGHAVVIQKVYRARLAKKKHKKLLHQHIIALRVEYFNKQAICIQKHYRAFMSRKYKHDFYARKEYIREVTRRSEEVVKEMRSSHKRQVEYEETTKYAECQVKFEEIFSKLHHLISTESCPSIFNSPYTALTGGPPTIAGQHVEDYLRKTKKGELAKTLPQVDENSIAGLDKSFEDSFAETKERFAGRTPITYKPFISAGSSNVLTSEPTLRASTPYKSTAQREAQAKANAAKGNISHKPFVTAFKKGQLFEDTLFE
ncbi:hypothetical protein HOP50_08g53280 [Chloropicon primus]|uniref:Uncharacterized protein n=1 Tax=Chloropicon primus TaxID=1764295 RepID=A0A5B8MTM2_9CHLO|nr:hypothetical protein A3770_08p52980 [Chloropicon primus]UPR02004.1 hypothetical protein HOP50_08g53280 [Chloropicon primus]|eukprot:QDZ22780.1 hypothetical protein A3770_08p52980 [Chloropicon primus]